MWFWPGQTWDHNRLIFEVNRDLPDILGITSVVGKNILGVTVVGLFYLVTGFGIHKLCTLTEFNRKILKRMSLIQYLTLQFLVITMLGLPAKILARLLFRIKYVWVSPWFNV